MEDYFLIHKCIADQGTDIDIQHLEERYRVSLAVRNLFLRAAAVEKTLNESINAPQSTSSASQRAAY